MWKFVNARFMRYVKLILCKLVSYCVVYADFPLKIDVNKVF